MVYLLLPNKLHCFGGYLQQAYLSRRRLFYMVSETQHFEGDDKNFLRLQMNFVYSKWATTRNKDI
jgi:hypothetical protein